jgi:hypothetical protein
MAFEGAPLGEIMTSKSELETYPAEIRWGGRLDGGKENLSVWRGSISAKLSLIKERFGLPGEMDAQDLMTELKAAAEYFFIQAKIPAQVRCIDGRGEGDDQADEPVLGPQVPGGAPVMSIAWRIASGLEPGITVDSDLNKFKGILKDKDLPFLPGAHEDEHNVNHPENTGCGAIDKMLDILKIMGECNETENGKVYQVYDYAKAIALEYCEGDEAIFDRIFDDIQVKLELLNAQRYNDRYFLKDEQTGHHHFRKRVVNRIKDVGQEAGRKTVEKLQGAHNEVFLLINRAAGETFHRDGFAALSGNRAQAFGYDVWHAVQRAKAIFPDDREKQRTMIVTNVMYAVGTAMALTDGSLEYGIRE